jgi:hypothetical protein
MRAILVTRQGDGERRHAHAQIALVEHSFGQQHGQRILGWRWDDIDNG